MGQDRIHPGGPVRYFHDPEARSIWAIPDTPDVIERRETVTKRRKHPKRLGWLAYAEILQIRADNWIRPDTNQWHYPLTQHPKQNFGPDDQLNDVRAYFNSHHHFIAGEEISRERFDSLRNEYEGIARKNPVPQPLPPPLR